MKIATQEDCNNIQWQHKNGFIIMSDNYPGGNILGGNHPGSSLPISPNTVYTTNNSFQVIIF